ncbi:MAG: GNAT family N-acetyltransferase, partial [Acidobacteriota bacterium]|nr:GNAT family N-acetyltransferase [Acidobacteriota bacterium]
MVGPVEIRIRRARPSEAGELTRIAHAAKRHWGYPEEWIALWSGDLTLTREFVEATPVYVAERGETLLGLYAIVGEPPEPELEHVWVDPEHMGQGV